MTTRHAYTPLNSLTGVLVFMLAMIVCQAAFAQVCCHRVRCPECPAGQFSTEHYYQIVANAGNCPSYTATNPNQVLRSQQQVDMSECSASADCPSATVNWTVGANSCTAAQGVVTHGDSGSVNDSTDPNTGSATFSCNNGVRTEEAGATCNVVAPPCTPVDGACGATGTAMLNGVCTTGAYEGWRVSGGVWVECTNPVVTCPAQTLTWNVSGEDCSADAATTNAGQLVSLRDSTTPGVGTASYYCNGTGSWSVQSGATCSSAPVCNTPPPPCTSQTHVED
ncbi:MAG: hypothetical protein V4621_05000 [Pseudomonadota bacterium]